MRLKSLLQVSFGNVKIYHEDYGFIFTGLVIDATLQIKHHELRNYNVIALTHGISDEIEYIKIYVK